MKIVFDPIYTNDPSHCATSVKFRKIADYLLEQREDVFFYWLIPDWTTEESREWLPVSDRIRYIEFPYDKFDRVKEYYRMRPELERLLAFNGELWDADMVITTRVDMAGVFKTISNRPSQKSQEWSKRVILIEGMPIMDFKKALGLSNVYAQNMQTVMGYLLADKTAISSFWEKAEIIKIAKSYFAPSQIRRLHENIIETSAILTTHLKLKKKEKILPMIKGERPFTLGFTGRLNASKIRIYEIFDVMEKNWIMKGDRGQIRCVMSTVSKSNGRVLYEGKKQLPPWLEVMRPKREEFWRLFHEDVDVFIFMSIDEGYSMTLMEPVMLGCPAIVNRDKWSVGQLGPEYPFYVSSVAEAYSLARSFQSNYAELYRVFTDWFTTHLTPMLQNRDKTYLPYMIEEEAREWDRLLAEYKGDTSHRTENEMLQIMLSEIGDAEEFVFKDVLTSAYKSGKLKTFNPKQADPDIARKVPNSFGFNWNFFRLMFKMFYGFDDASTRPGHMKKV